MAGDLAAAAAADELGAQGGELPPVPSPLPVPVPMPSAGPEEAHRPPPAIGEDEGVEMEVAERVVSAHDPFVEVAVVYGEEEDDDKGEEGEEDERLVAGGAVSVSYALFRGQAWAQAQATVNSVDGRCSQELLQRLPALEDQWCDDDHIALYCIADAADEVREKEREQ